MNTEISSIKKAIEGQNFHEAESLAWSLYNRNSKNFIVLKTLALTLLLQDKRLGAIDIYLKCIRLEPNDYDVLCNLGFLYLKIEEFSKSYQYALRAESHPNANFIPYSQIGELLFKKRDFENSLKYFELALKFINIKTLSQNIGIIHHYVDVLIALKKKMQAEQFVRYYQDREFTPDIFHHHSSFSPETVLDGDLAKVEKLLNFSNHQNHITSARQKAPLFFGLAKYYDEQDKKKSEEYFTKGNEEILKILRYFPLASQKYIQKTKELFYQDFYQKNLANNDSGKGLIFIVGMPRSGTTLLESIIATNKNVISGGELTSFNHLATAFINENKEQIELEEYKGLSVGEIYLNRIKFIQQSYPFFIDKLPDNYSCIGFIKTFLPQAKIIYIKRNPWDIAISLYKQFYVTNVPYASSFFNTAINIANHNELIRFWGDEMKFEFLTISYEELATQTEAVAQKVFEYCQLEGTYDEELRKKFFSRTASKHQITKAVNSSSISKKAFADQKDKFYEALQNQQKYWQN